MSEPIYAGGAVGYDELMARATRLFIASLLRAAHLAPGHRVLDVATGTGAAAQAAAELVGASGSVTAGDISATMLDVARTNLKGLPIALETFDGHELPYPDRHFDVVVCQLGLMFFSDPARGLSEFRRVLRDGGWTGVSVSSAPERTLFGRVGAVIARHCTGKGGEAQSLLLAEGARAPPLIAHGRRLPRRACRQASTTCM
jgi:ubiquinone/menaquinone biosynthesis C-methylase UbiE